MKNRILSSVKDKETGMFKIILMFTEKGKQLYMYSKKGFETNDLADSFHEEVLESLESGKTSARVRSLNRISVTRSMELYIQLNVGDFVFINPRVFTRRFNAERSLEKIEDYLRTLRLDTSDSPKKSKKELNAI